MQAADAPGIPCPRPRPRAMLPSMTDFPAGEAGVGGSSGEQIRAGLAMGLGGRIARACSPLGLLNGLAPRRLAGRDIAYGPAPRQRLDIYLPEAGRLPAPVVVFLYGGGWDSGAKAMYRFLGGAFAARGYVTVIPDYRLYPAVRHPAFIEDCAAAFAWTAAHIGGWGGSGSLFLMGHSAGAYNAAMLALDPRFLAAAGSRLSPRGTIGLAGPYDFLPLQSPRLRAIFGTPTPPDTQPINHVDGRNAPLLLIAGTADTTVLPANTTRLAARIQAAGGAVVAKLYPGINHREVIGAIGRPLRFLCPTLADCTRFMAAMA